MIKEGPNEIRKLLNLGVPFETEKKELKLSKEGGHGEKRIAFVGDYTGQEIEKALIKAIKNNPNIKILEHTQAFELIINNNTCYGVKAFNKNKIKSFFANFTIITSGGLGQIFKHTTNPSIATGDGIAMANQAGAKLKDLEFIQFHPTKLSILNSKKQFLISETVRGEGAYLLNQDRKRFMGKYHSKKELAPRDIVAQAIYQEEKKGQVFLDIRHKSKKYLNQRFPKIQKELKKHKLDLSKNIIPISPAAHYSCGGIKTNLKGETNIKNLFAFGEVACSGVHGANRLASNSLLEALVFSSQVLQSKNISQYKKDISKEINNFEKETLSSKIPTLSPQQKRIIYQLRSNLRKIMWDNAGIIRTQEKLKNGIKLIEKLQEKILKLPTNPQTSETSNMIITSKLVLKAALKQKNSIGCHLIEKD